MEVLIGITLFFTFIPLAVYIIYLAAILFTKKKAVVPLKDYPEISIVIPAYNEALVLYDRIKNISLSYPSELFELVIVDDSSTDDTVSVAKKAFEDLGIEGTVISNKVRSGVNFSVNKGVSATKREIIVLTGADGEFDKNTIPLLLSVLLSSDDVGAVSGDLIPVSNKKAVTTRSEDAYRSVFGKICTWESNLHSTYCFNGPATALKKKARADVHVTKGADDASTALGIIKNGYRCLYVPDAKFYEYIPDKFEEQKRQKVRRASRLLQASWVHKNLLSTNYGLFGTVIFPLRMLMFFICPFCILISFVLWIYVLSSFNLLYGAIFGISVLSIMAIGHFKTNMLSSFLLYQIYLFLGLLYLVKDVHIWEPTERVS
ncbi:glycosyltransferase [Methanolobus psychrotolerans]|uniref:glycosyltransferase n=1 Tax=Methanolobus psychrotolerans TaxID=1874706 RepID=UPI000B91B959|nr:glycosyltransferase [Methanolobus psychrotolerans]